MNTLCAECEKPSPTVVVDRTGATICSDCAAAFFTHCSSCQTLFPQDEAMQSNDSIFCSDCFTKPIGSVNAELPDEAAIEALIAEYVQLHSDGKRISERLDEIKELFKTVAAAKQRVAGAVVLRAGEAAVKCSYKVMVKYNTNKVAALESALDEAAFAALFERKVSYAPVKGKIEEVINSTDEANAALRNALDAATERTETASITVVPVPKKK